MSTAKITFTEITIESQKTLPTDPAESHLFAEAPFTLEREGKTYNDNSVTIRQPFGTDVNETIEIESRHPSYKGNWNHNEFHDIVERYWRLAEQRARITFGIPTTARNFAKERIRILLTQTYDLDVPD